MMKFRRPERPAASLEIAHTLCGDRGAPLTALRQILLHFLLRADHPLTAYKRIPRLEAELGSKVAPQSVYRPLAFLVSQRHAPAN